MPNHLIVHFSFSHFFLDCLPNQHIFISKDGIFDIIIPKRSIAYKFLPFPSDFSLYKQIQSYKHIELIFLNCPEQARENLKLQALPLPVTFAQNTRHICRLLANNYLPSPQPLPKPNREIMAKFIQQANSCSETDALLIAYQYNSLSHYLDQ